MRYKIWVCAYFGTFVYGQPAGDTDCPLVSYPAHRHLPEPHIVDRCGWYALVEVVEE